MQRPALEDFDSYLPRKIQKLLSNHGMYKKEFKDGKQVVTGTKRLKDSGAYTKCFGRKVANLFKKYRGRVSAKKLAQQRMRCLKNRSFVSTSRSC
eukprot:s583_g36.t1